MAGSYYSSGSPTSSSGARVEEMDKIEEMGGAVEAIDSGYYHKAILDEAYKWEQDVNEGERVVVGVNKYRDDDEPQPEYFRVDPALAERQREKLEKLRDERDSATAEQALAGLRDRRAKVRRTSCPRSSRRCTHTARSARSAAR